MLCNNILRRAQMYMHQRGHPLGEHMPYVSSRAHARGTPTSLLLLACSSVAACSVPSSPFLPCAHALTRPLQRISPL